MQIILLSLFFHNFCYAPKDQDHESRDLSQAETKLIVVTNWANYFFSAKMVRFEKKMSFWVKIVNILWGCLGFNKILFSARDESGDLWANGEKITQI